MSKCLYISILCLICTLFLIGCSEDLIDEPVFTFYNSMGTKIDSVQIAISGGSYAEKTYNIEPYETVRHRFSPPEEAVKGEGVVLEMFMDTVFRRNYVGESGATLFSKRLFADDKLKFTILEDENAIVRFWKDASVNDYYAKRYDIRHISTEIIYNPDTMPGFEAQPFIQQVGDTLIISDYWAMNDYYDIAISFDDLYDCYGNIKLRYTITSASRQVAEIAAPTVEVTVKFTGFESSYPHETLSVSANVRSGYQYTRTPTDLEKERGFRSMGGKIEQVSIPVL